MGDLGLQDSVIKFTNYGYTATLLNNGEVLVAGGEQDDDQGAIAECQIYNPLTGEWRLVAARYLFGTSGSWARTRTSRCSSTSS